MYVHTYIHSYVQTFDRKTYLQLSAGMEEGQYNFVYFEI